MGQPGWYGMVAAVLGLAACSNGSPGGEVARPPATSPGGEVARPPARVERPAADAGGPATAAPAIDCRARIQRIRGWEDGPLPALGGPLRINFDRGLTFPISSSARITVDQDVNLDAIELLGRPPDGDRTISGISLRFRAGGHSDPELTSRVRSVVSRGRLATLHIAADASVPAHMVETVATAVAATTPSRLLVRLTDETMVDRFLVAFPELPTRIADVFRRNPALGLPHDDFGPAVVAAADGCPGSMRALATLEHGGGIAALAPRLADALEHCSCRMADFDFFEALVVYGVMPRNDLGWLPIQFSTDPGAIDLNLGANPTVNDLVNALSRLPAADLDRPIRSLRRK